MKRAMALLSWMAPGKKAEHETPSACQQFGHHGPTKQTEATAIRTLGGIQQRHLAKRALGQELGLLAISGQVELGGGNLHAVVLGGNQSLEGTEISGERIQSLQIKVLAAVQRQRAEET